MTDLVIIGAGGLGREVAAMLESSDCYPNVYGFLDDNSSLHDTRILGHEVLGAASWLENRDTPYVIAIGNVSARKNLAGQLQGSTASEPLIEKHIPWHSTLQIGDGSVLCRGVSPTVNVTIGRHVYINLHCTVGHDSWIGDFSVLHPGVHISGNVTIGQTVQIGTGAVILPGVHVRDGATIGAGAVVLDNVPAGETVVGIPARSAI